jgi:hypothetical protein
MPKHVTHDRCPYALRPLAELEPETDDEHVFPDSIGGVKDYSVRVGKKANSDLGSRIDAPLVDSMVIGGLRLQHGIRSRSGRLKWTLRGSTKDAGREVDVTFCEDGTSEVFFRKPVEMNDSRTVGKLIVTPKERDAFLKTFIENHQRKGRKVQIAAESLSLVESIEIPIAVDMVALKRAMIKIAYAATYEYLGDAFLNDPLIPEWHKAFLGNDASRVRDAKLHGVAFDTHNILNLMLPALEPYEHAVAIANLQMQGPVVAVTLFGKSFHSLVLIASETSDFGLTVGEGKIAICDAKAGKTRFVNFMDHLVATSNQMPGIDVPGV